MKTTADQDNILFALIDSSLLKALINGKIYKGERPLNSTKEDIVIKSLLITDGTLQEGVVNVNIYIPKMNANIDGVNQVITDTKRIKAVLDVAKEVLKEHYAENLALWTSRQMEFDEAEIQQTRLNFRIELRLASST